MEDVLHNKVKHEKMNIPPLSITIFLIVIQLLILVGVYYYMEDMKGIFNISWHIISVFAAIFVINKENENSAYKIAWIMPMCIFPIVGLILYVIIKVFSGSKILTLLLRDKIRKSRSYISQNNIVFEEFCKKSSEYAGLANYLFKDEYFPIYSNDDITYYPLGELVFDAIKQEILNAKGKSVLHLNGSTHHWKKLLPDIESIDGYVVIVNDTGAEILRNEEWETCDYKLIHVSELEKILEEWVDSIPNHDAKLALLTKVAEQQIKKEHSNLDLDTFRTTFGV